ncbi:MAG: hypothetical protein WCQ64_06820 [Acidobacteriota bacterium]
MPKQALSVTIEDANVTWLRGRVRSGKRRSLSEALDDVVTQARLGGRTDDARSVVGTVDIAGGDATLSDADGDVRRAFQAALGGRRGRG